MRANTTIADRPLLKSEIYNVIHALLVNMTNINAITEIDEKYRSGYADALHALTISLDINPPLPSMNFNENWPQRTAYKKAEIRSMAFALYASIVNTRVHEDYANGYIDALTSLLTALNITPGRIMRNIPLVQIYEGNG